MMHAIVQPIITYKEHMWVFTEKKQRSLQHNLALSSITTVSTLNLTLLNYFHKQIMIIRKLTVKIFSSMLYVIKSFFFFAGMVEDGYHILCANYTSRNAFGKPFEWSKNLNISEYQWLHGFNAEFHVIGPPMVRWGLHYQHRLIIEL